MARPKSGEAMVTICTRVPKAIADELDRRAQRAKKKPAELHREVMMEAMVPTAASRVRRKGSVTGKGPAPTSAPPAMRNSVARSPKPFAGPFPKTV